MNDWNIQSRAHTCQGCSQQFSDQQPYHTVLFDLKREIQRLDLCEACWKGDHAEGARDRKGFISHWQGVFEVPPAAPPEAIRKENAETLLRKIMELNDPQYATASYILAAKLERQRVLKVKEQFQRDGRRYFLYEHAKTGDVFTIPDPGLQLNQLEQVQREVAALLDHGFNPPATAATATAADETSGTVADHSENESEPGSGPLETNAPEPEPLSR
jgi:hypothetical protein